MPRHDGPLPRHEAPLPRYEAPISGPEGTAGAHGSPGDAAGAHGSPGDAAGAHGSPDAELAGILPRITGPSGQFGHRQHINLAFVAVRRYGMPAATVRICGWLQHITAYERAPQKYHHTVSRAWVEIVAHHVDADPDCADFATFARRNPALLDKRLLGRHYQSSTLAASPARRGWVEPDLLPFPWSARGNPA
jgi:hypothetical protein